MIDNADGSHDPGVEYRIENGIRLRYTFERAGSVPRRKAHSTKASKSKNK